MKLPLTSGKEMCKLVSKLGFELRHRKGSHTFWKHSTGKTTVIPLHKQLKRSLTRKQTLFFRKEKCLYPQKKLFLDEFIAGSTLLNPLFD